MKRGEVVVAAYRGPASPRARIAQGVGMVSEDRKGEGLAQALSIADNLAMPERAGFLVSPSGRAKNAARWIEKVPPD